MQFLSSQMCTVSINIQTNKGLEALKKMYDKFDVSIPFEEINRQLELSLLYGVLCLMIN